MNDSERTGDSPIPPPPPSSGPKSTGADALLWAGVFIGVGGNTIASLADLEVIVGIPFGVLALSCIVGLVTRHLRRRRSRA